MLMMMMVFNNFTLKQTFHCLPLGSNNSNIQLLRDSNVRYIYLVFSFIFCMIELFQSVSTSINPLTLFFSMITTFAGCCCGYDVNDTVYVHVT